MYQISQNSSFYTQPSAIQFFSLLQKEKITSDKAELRLDQEEAE